MTYDPSKANQGQQKPYKPYGEQSQGQRPGQTQQEKMNNKSKSKMKEKIQQGRFKKSK